MDDRTGSAWQGTSLSALTLSFLAGGIVGATAALLLAPQSGSVTREIMGRKLSDAADSARELKDRASRRGAGVREEATHEGLAMPEPQEPYREHVAAFDATLKPEREPRSARTRGTQQA